MHVHGVAKIPDDTLGAQPARFELVRIAAFAMQNLIVADGHAAPANPVFAVTGVNMVEIGQRNPSGSILCQNIRSVASAIRNLID